MSDEQKLGEPAEKKIDLAEVETRALIDELQSRGRVLGFRIWKKPEVEGAGPDLFIYTRELMTDDLKLRVIRSIIEHGT